MITRTSNFIEEDLELQRYASTPQENKPRFNWREVAEASDEIAEPTSRIKVQVGDQQRDFDLAEVADTIGSALTDLMLSRNEEDIYNETNRRRVSAISKAVAKELLAQVPEDVDGHHLLSADEVTRIIEGALVKQNAHDIAKSLVIRHKTAPRRRGSKVDAGPTASVEGAKVGGRTVRVIRRSGEVVAWDPNKVEVAVRSAFLSQSKDSSPAAAIANALSESFQRKGQDYIHIEDLQDRVQEQLMKQGHYKVAEAFILYRRHRSEQRMRQAAAAPHVDDDASQDAMILVKKPDGDTFLWDGVDLKKRIEFASIGLDLCLSSEEIEQELRCSFFSEMTTQELRQTVTLNAKSLIERDADFAKFAGRILLTYIYEEVLGWNIVLDGIEALPTLHRRTFRANLIRGIEIERLSEKLTNFDIDKLADAIDPSADLDFDYLGIQTLYDRYLIIDKQTTPHRRLETPQLFWLRVSMGIFIAEEENAEDKIIALYNLYKGRRFCSSTPTLFNAGTLHSQLSSCYLYKVDDSIDSIMQRGIAENAFLSKWAGGLGGSWTAVRGTGSYIKGTNGESQGVVPFLKLHNDQLVAVNQGGKRRGSGCAYLETWHNDITDFLELRRNVGDERRRTHDMNTANWIPDLFMKRMEARGNWTLFRANEAPDLHELYGRAFEERYVEYEAKAKAGEIFGKEIEAIDLWKQMLKMIFETGHPWITFKDPCNVRSPQDHAGVIHSSNLCTEITLNTGPEETAVCNLGSVVLDSHIKRDGSLDLEKLRDTVRIAVRALDNVIDINFYPTEPAKTANQRHRPIGLGVMGLQNSLFKRDTPFASEEAVEFNDEFMEAIAYFAYEASSDLAAERGSYSSFEGSKWHRGLMPADTLDLLEEERGLTIDVPRGGKMDWDSLREKIKTQGMRNSNVLAIAPTATISNIMGSTPCIEPTFKNLFAKGNLAGDFIVLNQYLVRDLKALNLWNEEMMERLKYYDGELTDIDEIPDKLKEKYATAFAIDYNWLIEAAARRQKWIDQSQSVNLFLGSPDIKSLSHMYRAAWHKGLKTTYYLRTTAASNIEKASIKAKKDLRGVDGTSADGDAEGREYTAEEKMVCSIDNGPECEACQ